MLYVVFARSYLTGACAVINSHTREESAEKQRDDWRTIAGDRLHVSILQLTHTQTAALVDVLGCRAANRANLLNAA